MNMILRAKTVSGPQAHDLGLVTEVWPNTELKQRAVELATELAALPATAMAAMLRCLVTADDRTLDESLRDERDAFHATLGSPDMIEGMTAFMEKRKPEFNRSG
jgi:enoyl-CoA hydratase